VRNIKDSDLPHWWKGEVGVSRNRIVHIGRLSLVPGLQARTWSTFLRHERSITLVNEPIRAGDVMTFNGFIVKVPVAFGVRDYDAAVIWCEVFEQFVSAAEYQPSHQARK
jgi:hypothetical protein